MVRKQDLVGIMEITALLSVALRAAYGALKVSGLVGVPAESMVRALHDRSPQSPLWCCCALRLPGCLCWTGPSGVCGPPVWLGVLLMASGLVISSAVRFEGHILLTRASSSTEQTKSTSKARERSDRTPAHRVSSSPRGRSRPAVESGRDAERISLVAAYQHAGGAPRR